MVTSAHHESKGKVSDNRQRPPCKLGEAQAVPVSLGDPLMAVPEDGTRRGQKWKIQRHHVVMCLQVTWAEPNSTCLGWSLQLSFPVGSQRMLLVHISN